MQAHTTRSATLQPGRVLALTAALAALVAAGLAAPAPAWAQAAAPDKTPVAKAVAGKDADEPGGDFLLLDRVAAVVNDSIVLESELKARMAPLLAGLESISDARERARRQDKLMAQMLDDMIAEELVVQAAREAKLEVGKREIDAALDEIKRQNDLDDAGLKAALAEQGYTISAYRKEIERQLLHMRAINMLVRPRVNVSDEDVRARYDEMSRRSAAVSKVRLKHILLALPERPTDAQVAEAKARAAAIIEQARGGADFNELARAHSDDEATRDAGGDLGWIERGSIATEWEVIVFAMDKGEVRGPISGPRGLHVFYVEDLARADLEPFEAVQEQLRSELYRKEMDRETGAWIEEIRKKAYIDRKL
ncbi:peptidylprolyl isomerase [Haliangium sp.]